MKKLPSIFLLLVATVISSRADGGNETNTSPVGDRQLQEILARSSGIKSAKAGLGRDLFNKFAAKYATCKSFFCEGHLSVVSTMMGEDRPFKSEERFTIRFQRPALLRVDWQTPNQSTFAPTTCSLYTENGKYWGMPSFRRTPEEFTDLARGIGAYAGISGGMTYTIPNFLLGEKGYFHAFTCTILPDEKVEGHDCYAVELAEKNTGTWTLFIDRADYALRRSKQIHEITLEQSKKNQAEMAAEMKGKNIPLPKIPEAGYSITTVVDYTNIVFDQEMTPEQFVFKDGK